MDFSLWFRTVRTALYFILYGSLRQDMNFDKETKKALTHKVNICNTEKYPKKLIVFSISCQFL